MPGCDDDVARARAATQRLSDVDASGLADSPREEAYDRLTRTVVRALGVPVALVSVVDDERQFFKSEVGLGEPWATRRGTALSHSFCRHVVRVDAPFLVTDARADARVQDNAAIDDLGVVGYAGVPVHGPGGLPIGALCAITHEPRAWREDEVLMLQDLAAAATEMIAMRAAAAEQRAALSDLSHHLRTGLTALQLGAADLEAEASSPAARQQAAELAEALQAQGIAVDALLHSAAARILGHARDVPLLPLLEAVAGRASGPRTVRVAPSAPVALSVPVAELSRLLDELVALLLMHGAGEVQLQVVAEAASVRLRVRDESNGLPADVVAKVTSRRDHANGALKEPSLAERAVACGGRLVRTSSRPTTWDVLLPRT